MTLFLRESRDRLEQWRPPQGARLDEQRRESRLPSMPLHDDAHTPRASEHDSKMLKDSLVKATMMKLAGLLLIIRAASRAFRPMIAFRHL